MNVPKKNEPVEDQSESIDWPDPQELVSSVEPESYPVDAFPDSVSRAIKEVQTFNMAPLALIGSTALAALSTASQALVDVEINESLRYPVSLSLLTIADSGERKSSCERIFFRPIEKFETAAAAKAAAEQKKYEGLVKYRAASDGEIVPDHSHPDDDERSKRVPRLLYSDITSESLAEKLAHVWSSGAIVCAEGGLVLGGHCMGREAILRTLGLWNVLWDGSTYTIDRKTTGSIKGRNRGLTLSLQVQSGALACFLGSSGGLPRATGYLARCLISYPESTIGSRFFNEENSALPAVQGVHRLIESLLQTPVGLETDGVIRVRKVLALSSEGKAEWIRFYNAIEFASAVDGHYHQIKDVASRAAENAARVAGLFHLANKGIEAAGKIEAGEVIAACSLVRFHLGQSLAFLSLLQMPRGQANSVKLSGYLRSQCINLHKNVVTKRDVGYKGPIPFKNDSIVIDATLKTLEEAGHVRVLRKGRSDQIYINPKLL